MPRCCFRGASGCWFATDAVARRVPGPDDCNAARSPASSGLRPRPAPGPQERRRAIRCEPSFRRVLSESGDAVCDVVDSGDPEKEVLETFLQVLEVLERSWVLGPQLLPD